MSESLALAQIRERLFQARAAQIGQLSARLDDARRNGARRGGTPVAGDRVFDVTTGLEGEVLHVARENVVVPTAGR